MLAEEGCSDPLLAIQDARRILQGNRDDGLAIKSVLGSRVQLARSQVAIDGFRAFNAPPTAIASM
jgi:hypothetical protein